MSDSTVLQRPHAPAAFFRFLRPVAITIALVALIVASAYVSVPLPFSPVPMTMQSLAVLMAGIWAGPRVGAAACIAYLGLAFAGLPVLAGGAAVPGAALLGKPTFGYLAAFIPAAWVAGVLLQSVANRALGALLALTAGHIVIFAGGVGYLATLMPLGQALAVGFAPFLLGSVVKIFLGVALAVATPARLVR